LKSELLDYIPLWLLFLVTCFFSWLALEGGFRFGKWRHNRATEEKEGPVNAMVGSILGLLAFLLAFTFSMAATRFDARRQAILTEATAIGTAYLRSRLLAEPQRTETARLLREYVDVRARTVTEGNVAESVARSTELQELLWSEAVKAAENKSTPAGMAGFFILSLNETIAVHAIRVQTGLRSRIPSIIWTGLLSLALLAMASVGYQAGLAAMRRSPVMLGMVLAFAGVLFLIADLDRGQEGFLRVSQQALIDLQSSMHDPKQ